MLVASDTSPISNLAVIARLDLLRSQFQQIWIPRAVETELRDVTHPSALADINRALQLQEGWIKSGSLDLALTAVRLKRLPSGSSCLPADLVLRITGVLGILLCAKREGQIAALKAEIEALRTRARFFISTGLEDQVLRNAGE